MSWPAPRRIYERDAFDLRRVHRALSPFSLIHDRSAPDWRRIEGGEGVCGEQTRDTAKLIVILVGRIINSQSASVSGWMLSRIRGSSPFSDLHPLFSLSSPPPPCPSCGHPYVTTSVFSAVRRYLAVLENDGQFRISIGFAPILNLQRICDDFGFHGTRDSIFLLLFLERWFCFFPCFEGVWGCLKDV